MNSMFATMTDFLAAPQTAENHSAQFHQPLTQNEAADAEQFSALIAAMIQTGQQTLEKNSASDSIEAEPGSAFTILPGAIGQTIATRLPVDGIESETTARVMPFVTENKLQEPTTSFSAREALLSGNENSVTMPGIFSDLEMLSAQSVRYISPSVQNAVTGKIGNGSEPNSAGAYPRNITPEMLPEFIATEMPEDALNDAQHQASGIILKAEPFLNSRSASSTDNLTEGGKTISLSGSPQIAEKLFSADALTMANESQSDAALIRHPTTDELNPSLMNEAKRSLNLNQESEIPVIDFQPESIAASASPSGTSGESNPAASDDLMHIEYAVRSDSGEFSAVEKNHFQAAGSRADREKTQLPGAALVTDAFAVLREEQTVEMSAEGVPRVESAMPKQVAQNFPPERITVHSGSLIEPPLMALRETAGRSILSTPVRNPEPQVPESAGQFSAPAPESFPVQSHNDSIVQTPTVTLPSALSAHIAQSVFRWMRSGLPEKREISAGNIRQLMTDEMESEVLPFELSASFSILDEELRTTDLSTDSIASENTTETVLASVSHPQSEILLKPGVHQSVELPLEKKINPRKVEIVRRPTEFPGSVIDRSSETEMTLPRTDSQPRQTSEQLKTDLTFFPRLTALGHPNAGNASGSALNSSGEHALTGSVPTVASEFRHLAAQVIDPVQHLSRTLLPQETRTLQLNLSPEQLGPLEIRLTRDADGQIRAQLTADRAETQQVLAERLDDLRHALESAGLSLSQVEIVERPEPRPETALLSSHERNFSGNPENPSSQNWQQRFAREPFTASDEAADQPWNPSTASGSNVVLEDRLLSRQA
jgi:hypothetical protein